MYVGSVQSLYVNFSKLLYRGENGIFIFGRSDVAYGCLRPSKQISKQASKQAEGTELVALAVTSEFVCLLASNTY